MHQQLMLVAHTWKTWMPKNSVDLYYWSKKTEKTSSIYARWQADIIYPNWDIFLTSLPERQKPRHIQK